MYIKIILLTMLFVSSVFISCGTDFFEDKYSYDNQDRLQKENYINALEKKNIEYIYDNNGNIIEIRMN